MSYKVWESKTFIPPVKKEGKKQESDFTPPVKNEGNKQESDSEVKKDTKPEVETKTIKVDKTQKKGIAKKVLTEKSIPVSELIDVLCKEMETFTQHLVNAKWQRDQLGNLKQSLPNGWVLTIEDYSENFRTLYQDEIQSAHYQYAQVTLYCQVSWFSCPTCQAQIHEAAAFISEDLLHDPFAILAFHKSYKKYLLEQGIEIQHQVFYSDGCPTQYKAKQPFEHTRTSKETLGHTSEHCFFGTRHGKSECDAVGGLLKSKARSHVAARAGLIRNADEFFQFCKTLEKKVECAKGEHKSRVIFKVDDIERPKKERTLVPLPGTQKLHHIKAGENDGEVVYRSKSCHCEEGCRDGSKSEECINQEQTGAWKTHNMHVPVRKSMGKNTLLQQTAKKTVIGDVKAHSVKVKINVDSKSEASQSTTSKSRTGGFKKAQSLKVKENVEVKSPDCWTTPPKPELVTTVSKRQLNFNDMKDVSSNSQSKNPRLHTESDPRRSKRLLPSQHASSTVDEASHGKRKKVKLQQPGEKMVEEHNDVRPTLRRSSRLQCAIVLKSRALAKARNQ
jgi:hypothetical protein